jgi:hypothetical protein
MRLINEAPGLLNLTRKTGIRWPSGRWLLLLSFIIAPFFAATAQNGIDYAIHANIIYHFTKYVEWPDEQKTGDFVIGIVGETPLTDELKKTVANKTIRDQKIVVKRFETSRAVFSCHILFIAEEETPSVKKIASRTAGMPVLIVTESEGMALRGASINFIIVAERLKLEINKKDIELRHLSIASELLQLGIIVK